ncbi:MAG: class I lanthipeptide [Hyphomicrobiales bacterium]
MKKLNFKKETVSILDKQMQHQINGGFCTNNWTGCPSKTSCVICEVSGDDETCPSIIKD